MTFDVGTIIEFDGSWPHKDASRPLIIGMAGGSGSGKTTIVRSVVEIVGPDLIALIPHDAYYRAQDHLTYDERTQINYDHPDSLETELLVEHLEMLRAGLPIDRPVYDFSTHTRTGDTVRVVPESVILVEGILILSEPDLRDLFDLRVYIDTDADLRLIRRLQRDILERGRTVDSVLTQYERTVRPMHLQFVEPSKRYADIIVPEGINAGAVGTVTSTIRHFLSVREPTS